MGNGLNGILGQSMVRVLQAAVRENNLGQKQELAVNLIQSMVARRVRESPR